MLAVLVSVNHKPVRLLQAVQVEKLDDDPQGWRMYEVMHSTPKRRIKHRRGDGPERLAVLLLESLREAAPCTG